ncbi:MAG: regulatory protein RecX [Oscillospiraceae bacterium]
MLITAIEPRRKSLRALYLDGELAVNISAQTLLSSRFQVGTEITDRGASRAFGGFRANRAKEKALYLIAHRDHSKKELVDKIRRTASQEAAEKAADRMEEIGLIDDRDYARRYASELFQRKYFARKRVEYELKQRGLIQTLSRNCWKNWSRSLWDGSVPW